MDTRDDLFDIITFGKCKCGKVGAEEHQCPYDADIHNDPDSMCNCCKECTRNCSDDI